MTTSHERNGGVSDNTFHAAAAAQSGDQGIQINQFARTPRGPRSRVRFSLATIAVLLIFGGAGVALIKIADRDTPSDRPGQSALAPADAVSRSPSPPSPSLTPGTSQAPAAPTASAPRASGPTRTPHAEEAAPPRDAVSTPPAPDEKQPRADRRDAAPRRFQNQTSGLCLAIPEASTRDTTAAVQWRCSTSASQLWALQPVPGGYRLRNMGSDKCLVADGKYGGTVSQRMCGTAADQVWVRDDLERLRNPQSGWCLAIPYGSTKELEKPIQWTCTENLDQRWT
ncbi:RICIN domain-containing protein [Streptomyces sp. DG1A-41]|uniref:RICIN domain-containing protein n=1 Tax=Streptomyces sp. DG1A-41 TaxID=3125779 RepID=UPI0030D4447B